MLLVLSACAELAPVVDERRTAARFLDGPADTLVGVPGEQYGHGLAVVEDLSGDGWPDLAIGAPWSERNGTPVGRVEVLAAGAAFPEPPIVGFQAPFTASWAAFGQSVDTIGDLDGDGLVDLALGAPVISDGQVLTFRTDGTLLGTIMAPYGAVEYGYALVGGDFDGDGWGEVAIGDPDTTLSYPLEGVVELYEGPLPVTRSFQVHGGDDFAKLGHALTVLDANGDGYPELAASAFGKGPYAEGAVLVFAGASGGLSPTPVTIDGAASGSGWLGAGIAGTDLDGDGFEDLVAGAPVAGRLEVFFGGPAGLPPLPDALVPGAPGARVGTRVAAAGDVDGDGHPDVLALAPDQDLGGATLGAVLLFSGAPSGLDPIPTATIPADDLPGSIDLVQLAGLDVDQDGWSDPVIGLPDADQVLVWRGAPRDLDEDGVVAPDDCDDRDPAVYPGAPEICDRKDGDCDGALPADEADLDGDGFAACVDDCDDALAFVHPGAPELCDGVDDDCDGVFLWEEVDYDLDGFTTCTGDCSPYLASAYPGAPETCDGSDESCDTIIPADEFDGDNDGWTPCQGDCDDADPRRAVGWAELCDGIDQDCDGIVPADELDGDGDGVAPCAGDCDDLDPAVGPAAAEACDGRDTDCDGELPADELDGDADGAPACADCDDANTFVRPGHNEICNDTDDDCDGLVDDDDPDRVGGAAWYPDADGDGAGDPAGLVEACEGPPGMVRDGSDCDDADPDRFPAAEDVPGDGIDQDCDGLDAVEPAPTTPTDGATDDPSGEGPPAKDEAEGCGCASAGGGGAPLLALLLLGIRRRR